MVLELKNTKANGHINSGKVCFDQMSSVFVGFDDDCECASRCTWLQ